MTLTLDGSGSYFELTVNRRQATAVMDGGNWYLKEGHGYPDVTFLAQGRVRLSEVIARAFKSLGCDGV